MTPWLSAVRRAMAVCVLLLGLGAAGAHAQQSRPDDDAHKILVMLRLSPDHFRPNAAYGGDYGDQLARNARNRLAKGLARKYGLDLVEDGWPMPLIGIDCYVMRVPSDRSVDSAITAVSHDPLVVWSQPLAVYRAQGGGEGDPLFAVQPDAKAWRLADLHRVATGRGVVVAVIDSRIEVNHPDLTGQFVADQDFVDDHRSGPERHGTGVAGVIAAKEGNGVGIVGVAPDARLMALRACWQSGGAPAAPTLCSSLSLAKALHFAIEHKAEIINLSLAGPPDRLLDLLIATAMGRKISVVAAFDPTLPKGGFPASESGVIPVADESMRPLPAGVYGAPGRDIPTTEPGATWYLVNGNSFAAAHVSGLIALVHENRAATSRGGLVATGPTGGVVDACATLLRAYKPCDCSCPALALAAETGR